MSFDELFKKEGAAQPVQFHSIIDSSGSFPRKNLTSSGKQ